MGFIQRRQVRAMVREQISNSIVEIRNAHPNATDAEIEAEIQQRLGEEYGASPFFDMILQLLKEFLPLLLELLKKKAPSDVNQKTMDTPIPKSSDEAAFTPNVRR